MLSLPEEWDTFRIAKIYQNCSLKHNPQKLANPVKIEQMFADPIFILQVMGKSVESTYSVSNAKLNEESKFGRMGA